MKTVVISGATSGIGNATLKALINRGYRVIGLGRSAEKIKNCLREMDAEKGQAVFIQADLSSQEAIRMAVAQIKEIVPHGIDCLINNAGSFTSKYKETCDGLEWQFAVNHMAPFLLSQLLLTEIKEGGRIITVGSHAHHNARLHWKNPQMKRFYSSLGAYRQSKFFNILMTNELNRRYEENKIMAFVADPGLVNTEIGLKGTQGLSRLVWSIRRRSGQSAEEGAATSVFLATETDLTLKNGVYYKNSRPEPPDIRTGDPQLIKKLWTLSESLVK